MALRLRWGKQHGAFCQALPLLLATRPLCAREVAGGAWPGLCPAAAPLEASALRGRAPSPPSSPLCSAWRCGLRALCGGGRCSGPGSACPCCAASLVLSVSHAKSQSPSVCPMPLSWPTEAAAVHSAWSGSQAGVRWELRGGQMDKAWKLCKSNGGQENLCLPV